MSDTEEDYGWGEAEDFEDEKHFEFTCPVCGAVNDEWMDCWCYADLHWGD